MQAAEMKMLPHAMLRDALLALLKRMPITWLLVLVHACHKAYTFSRAISSRYPSPSRFLTIKCRRPAECPSGWCLLGDALGGSTGCIDVIDSYGIIESPSRPESPRDRKRRLSSERRLPVICESDCE